MLKLVYCWRQATNKGQGTTVFSGMLSSPRPKCPFVPWHVPGRVEVHCFSSNSHPLSLLLQEPFPGPMAMSLVYDVCSAPLTSSFSWVRDNQSAGIPYTPKFTYLSCRPTDVLPCFPFKRGLDGKSAGRSPPPALSYFEASAAKTLLTRVTLFANSPQTPGWEKCPLEHESDRQCSLQHSRPACLRPFQACITVRLPRLPNPASRSFPSQLLNLMNLLLQKLWLSICFYRL